MKTNRYLAMMAVTAGLLATPAFAGHYRPTVAPPVLSNIRGGAFEAARTCEALRVHAQHVSIRSRAQGEALAAITRLRDATRLFANATVSSYWPRPDWLRCCSEELLNAWIRVDMTFPMLCGPPPVAGWWSRAQGNLVALYNVASPVIGRPAGGPLPAALAASQNQPAVVRALPARP